MQIQKISAPLDPQCKAASKQAFCRNLRAGLGGATVTIHSVRFAAQTVPTCCRLSIEYQRIFFP